MFRPLIDLLGYIMYLCYTLTVNYGLAILLFTVVVKIIFLPLSVWQQKNSIKMVTIQPEVNQIKAQNINDSAKAGEEQLALYKKVGYRPFISLIPTLIQIPLIIGVISVVYNPLAYLLKLDTASVEALRAGLIAFRGTEQIGLAWQVEAIRLLESGELTAAASLAGAPVEAILAALRGFDRIFLGCDLLQIPNLTSGLILYPIMAIASTWLLCVLQNRSNVLQREQEGFSRWGTSLIMILLAAYLSFAVPAAAVLYWTAGNLLAIAVMYLMNFIMNPKKYIDYEALEKSKTVLAEAMQHKKTRRQVKEETQRSKRDYQRFLDAGKKELVFYSDSSGYYRYYKDLIEEILNTSDDIVIHYITDDPDDQTLAMESERFKTYYIDSNRMIVLFMKLETVIMATTIPDLNNYHLKRSIVDPHVEYLYLFHGMASTHLVVRKGSFDNYDTLFCVGQHQMDETRETEQLYGLKPKKLVAFGYPLLDGMIADYQKGLSAQEHDEQTRQIIVAPSHQSGNILETCVDELISSLLENGCHVILRPHPYWIKHNPNKVEQIAQSFEKYGELFYLDVDFGQNRTVYSSDVLVTDWSTVAYDFAFSTLKPCVFVNTEMKVRNPEYTRYEHQPLDITLRSQIGREIEPENAGTQIVSVVSDMIGNKDEFRKQIEQVRERTVFHLGHSVKEGGAYIIGQIMQARKEGQ